MLDRLRRLLARPRLGPEEVIRRRAERLEAEIRQRHEIERANLYLDAARPGDRPNRFVR